jgi:hypothetical protein
VDGPPRHLRTCFGRPKFGAGGSTMEPPHPTSNSTLPPSGIQNSYWVAWAGTLQLGRPCLARRLPRDPVSTTPLAPPRYVIYLLRLLVPFFMESKLMNGAVHSGHVPICRGFRMREPDLHRNQPHHSVYQFMYSYYPKVMMSTNTVLLSPTQLPC